MPNNAETPAFPVPDSQRVDNAKGLTKREWFAGMAMQGILSNQTIEVDYSQENKSTGVGKIISRWSYAIADAMMLAQSEKASDEK